MGLAVERVSVWSGFDRDNSATARERGRERRRKVDRIRGIGRSFADGDEAVWVVEHRQ
jgi:hypothetical protein